MEIDAVAVKGAFKKRRQYILTNLETVTLKTLRKQLEGDLGLPLDALKPHKKMLSELIDKLIAKAGASNAAQPGSSKKKHKKQPAEEVAAPPPRADRAAKDPAAKAGPRQYSNGVNKLRAICKQATITIPPTLYVKNKSDDELTAALEALLERHGLSASAGPNEVARAKQKLQIQRDLDGIDTSNIVEGGRRRRAGEAVSYRKLVDVESDGDNGSQDEGSEDGAVSSDDSEDCRDTEERTVARRASSDAEDAEADAEEGAGGLAAAVTGGAGEAALESPDENAGGNGERASPGAFKVGGMKKRRVINDWSDDERGVAPILSP